MHFRTEIKPLQSSIGLNHHSNILTIGSCFSDNIGNWLADLKFNCSVNPFGTVFNPLSIAKFFKDPKPDTDFIFFENDIWFSLHHHSQNNRMSKADLLNHLSLLHHQFKSKLVQTSQLFVTLGTSWVYRLKENNQIVSNCQKLPQYLFSKELLSTKEIICSLSELLENTPQQCKVIFTVSPVRHIKDGIIENSLSKARLIESIHTVIDQNKERCVYYPVYEIFMDDLRDYRFYEADLIHPNQQGLAYVKEHFQLSFFNDETIKLNSKISSIVNASRHIMINRDSKGSKDFILSTQKQIADLISVYPWLDFSAELSRLN